MLTWPWTDPVYTYKVYSKALELSKNIEFDMIIAVHMPLSSVIVGNKLKKKYPSTKFIPYFLDSLSGGRALKQMSMQWNLNKKLAWERRLLGNADKIIVMESSRLHHEKYNKSSNFYSKIKYLDIPLLIKPKIDTIGDTETSFSE